ncbi:arginine repressor [Streptococcus downei]|uniref:Arginine repressor n=1 Tax=Streptococcus downei MFe28 TaxID=764290 RepID=A0A380JD62_STRDO|nr:arginine repressor [Streptococcus downei]SUN35337.1 arginine repressor ArgR [Streptococcus downei MFe28]
MNKIERQNKIRAIIQEERVGTQEEIKASLARQGIAVTQATLSRDLREIGLLKRRDENGKLYYSLSAEETSHLSDVARDYIKKISRASFILVLSTELGEADVLANIIDREGRSDILGTVAGADTLLVICQDAVKAQTIEEELN